MNQLTISLDQLRRDGRKALSLFVTAGYPSISLTVPLVLELAKAGADMVELGIPFSDPVADGPTIQISSEIALRNGVTLYKTLEMAQEIRKKSNIPLVLMGYANPILAFGLENYLTTCTEVGIDGTIIADLPLEESDEYRRLAKEKNVATIFLAAPTTPEHRLVQLDNCSTGFLYCVSITGVTGERKGLANQVEAFLQQARAFVKNNPLLVGFGISTPEDARLVARYSDGVVIGSALIKVLHLSSENHLIENAAEFVRTIRKALDS